MLNQLYQEQTSDFLFLFISSIFWQSTYIYIYIYIYITYIYICICIYLYLSIYLYLIWTKETYFDNTFFPWGGKKHDFKERRGKKIISIFSTHWKNDELSWFLNINTLFPGSRNYFVNSFLQRLSKMKHWCKMFPMSKPNCLLGNRLY